MILKYVGCTLRPIDCKSAVNACNGNVTKYVFRYKDALQKSVPLRDLLSARFASGLALSGVSNTRFFNGDVRWSEMTACKDEDGSSLCHDKLQLWKST